MNNSKFTSGEWIAYCPHEILNSSHVSVENDHGVQICISEVYKSNLIERTANMNLIAAAPDMYNLLAEIADLDECQMIKGAIAEVLAKARGEAKND